MSLIEAAKKALEALEYAHATCKYENERQSKAIAGLREAIEEAEKVEPIGYIASMAYNDLRDGVFRDVSVYGEELDDTVAIYAAPQPEQQAKTADRIAELEVQVAQLTHKRLK
jgi:hypothetical protein